MFFRTAHVYRLIVSASVAFVVMLSTAFGQIANVYELAFVRDSQIFLVRSDGTGLVQLTSDGLNSEPTWSPDGTRIAFVRRAGGTNQIYVMNADGSNVCAALWRWSAGLRGRRTGRELPFRAAWRLEKDLCDAG